MAGGDRAHPRESARSLGRAPPGRARDHAGSFSRGSTGGDGSVVRFLFGDFTQDFVDESGETASFVPPAPSAAGVDYGIQIITDFNIAAHEWTVTITVEGPGVPGPV